MKWKGFVLTAFLVSFFSIFSVNAQYLEDPLVNRELEFFSTADVAYHFDLKGDLIYRKDATTTKKFPMSMIASIKMNSGTNPNKDSMTISHIHVIFGGQDNFTSKSFTGSLLWISDIAFSSVVSTELPFMGILIPVTVYMLGTVESPFKHLAATMTFKIKDGIYRPLEDKLEGRADGAQITR